MSTAANSTRNDQLFELPGRVAVVTGASRGLGQYFARALARAGADLVLTSRKRESLAEFEKEIQALGRRTVSLELDVRYQHNIQQMVTDAESAFGHLDILVNNAGVNVRKPALEVSWEDWNLILDTNLRGSFFVAQAVAVTAALLTLVPLPASRVMPASVPMERAAAAFAS